MAQRKKLQSAMTLCLIVATLASLVLKTPGLAGEESKQERSMSALERRANAEKLAETLCDEVSGAGETIQQILIQAGPESVPLVLDALEANWECCWLASGILRQFPKASITALAARLEDTAPHARRTAARVIGYLAAKRRLAPQQKEAALVVLLARLSDPEAEVRQAVAEAIGKIDRLNPAVVPVLGEALQSEDPSVRRHAAERLGQVGGRSQKTAVLLGKALGDADALVRFEVAVALANTGLKNGELRDQVTKILIEGCDLLSEDDSNSWKPKAALVEVGRPVLPAVYAALQQGSDSQRETAMYALARIGPADLRTAEALISALEDPKLSFDAVRGLQRMGDLVVPATSRLTPFANREAYERTLVEMGLPAVMPLLRVLQSESVEQAKAAGSAIARLGTLADPAGPGLVVAFPNTETASEAAAKVGCISLLIEAVRHPCRKVSESAIHALKECGPAAEGAVSVLMEALNAEKSDVDDWRDLSVSRATHVRDAAAGALGAIRSTAKDAVPALLRALQDTDHEVRQRAVEALGRIGSDPDNVVPALVQALSDGNEAVRLAACKSLGDIGPAPDVIPALLEVVRPKKEEGYENAKFREAAITALAELGADGPEVVDALIDVALRAQSAEVRHAAMKLLTKLALRSDTTLTTVVRLLDEDTPASKYVAVTVLCLMDDLWPRAKEALPTLIEMLEGRASDDAIMAIFSMGSHAASAVPALANVVKCADNEWYVRRNAARALGNIGSAARPALPVLRHVREAALGVTNVQLIDEIDIVIQQIESPRNDVLRRIRRFGSAAREPLSHYQLSKAAAKRLAEELSPAAIPTLLQILKQPNHDDAVVAALTLGELGGQDSASRLALESIIAGPRTADGRLLFVRIAAAESLLRTGPSAKALDFLLERQCWSRHPVDVVVPVALRGLGAHVLPALQRWLAEGAVEHSEDATRNLVWFLRESEFLGHLARDKSAIPMIEGTVDQLIEDLETADAQGRKRLLKILVWFGPIAAEKAGPLILKLLQSDDPELRLRVVYAVGALRVTGPGVLDRLGGLLTEEDPILRDAAAYALARLGRQSLPVLTQMLGHRLPDVRELAALTLGCLGPQARAEIGTLREATRDQAPSVRLQALRSLAAIDVLGYEVAPAMFACLPDKDAAVRRFAAARVRLLCRQALVNDSARIVGKAGVSHLIASLDDTLVCTEAFDSLCDLACCSDDAVETLGRFLDDSDATRREKAWYTLRILEGQALPAMIYARAAMQHPDRQIRFLAVELVVGMGAVAEEATRELLAALKDSDVGVRRLAASAFLVADRPSCSLLIHNSLNTALEDNDVYVRVYAARATWRLYRPKDADRLLSCLAEALDHEHAVAHGTVQQRLDARVAALYGFKEIGIQAAPAVPAIVNALSSTSEEVRKSTLDVLGGMFGAAGPAVPRIVQLLKQDESVEARQLAAIALGKIGQKDKEVLAALEEAAGKGRPAVSQAARQALTSLGVGQPSKHRSRGFGVER